MRVLTNLEFMKQEDIGRDGANSDVYRSIDPQLGAEIAIKEIEKAKIADQNGYFAEAQKLYASSHPNVVPVRFASYDDLKVYIAMPFFKNGSLKALLRLKHLTTREIIKISIDFLTGLQHIHFKKLIHFDIKPANILFDDSNRAMLTDFGLANWVDGKGITETDSFYGKHFVPESVMTNTATVQADIFQVGMTLYRMCNGEANFHEQFRGRNLNNPDQLQEAVNLMREHKLPRREFAPHIPYKLRKVVEKCLEFNPDKRFKSVLELINELSLVEDSLDWRYKPRDELQIWENDLDAYVVKVELEEKDGKFNMIVTKTNKESGKITNDHKKSAQGLKDLKAAKNKAFSLFKDKL